MGELRISGILVATIFVMGTFLVGLTFDDVYAPKKPKEIVVVGSKVKDVIRSSFLSECTYTYDGLDRRITVSAGKKPWVKIEDIPPEVTSVSLQCEFGDGSLSKPITVELDEDRKTRIKVMAGPSPADSFFDVFFDVFTDVDSFFDLLFATQEKTVQNMMAIRELQASLDSFFDIFISVDESSCEDGFVAKYDSRSSGWSCQPDETGDGGGGTPGDPLVEIKLIPQLTEPSECIESNAGVIFYLKRPDLGDPDKVCTCIDRDGDGVYAYADLLGDELCFPT